MPNIIDSIQISSSTFDVRDKSATTVVNLTQEQYDNLPSSAKTANVLYNITDATAGDLSQYWTSAQTQSAITEATSGKADTSYVDQSVSGKVDTSTFEAYSGNVETALSGKQDTLIAGENITISGNVISAEGGGIDSGTVQTMIDESISGKTNQSDFVSHSGNTSIHVTTAQTAAWDAKSDFSGNYNDLSNKPTIPSKTSDLTNDSDFATTGDVQTATADMATKTWVGQQGYLTQHQSLSNYYTKSETSGATEISTALASKADKSEIPSLDGYATETWVEGKGYLTEHQDISGKLDVSAFNTYSGSVNTQLNSKASESDLNALNNVVTAHTANATIHVTAQDKTNWSNKSDFSGDYNDLTNKPTIPTVPTNVSDFTNDAGYITSDDITGKTNQADFVSHSGNTTMHVTASEKSTWNNKSDFSGNYNDLSNKPTIPTSASQLTNDSGYITSSALDGYATEAYVTAATNDMATKTWVGQQGYLTQHQDISGKQDVSGMTAYTTTATTNALSGTVTAHTANTTIHVTAQDKTNWNNKSNFSGDYNDLTNKPTIPTVPTNVSDFTNDAGYITSNDISGKTNQSDFTAHTANTTVHVTSTEKATWNAKSDFSGDYNDLSNKLSAGTNITIVDNVISAEGGGKAVTAGTNISVTTGETADTINCTLNISNGTGTKSIKIGDGVTASGTLSLAQGDDANASGNWSTAFGRGKSSKQYAFSANNGQAKKGYSSAFGSSIANNTYGFATGAGGKANGHSSFVSGWYTNSNNNYEAAFGNYNNSVSASTTFGDSGNTLFSVGNGTADNARHNAFEIRQNGDIYLSNGTNDVKLQDYIQIKAVKISQSDYDQLQTKDPNTLYIITTT